MVATGAEVIELLHEVKDPEVPVISIVELGIVRGAEVDGSRVVVDITPTYSGCPAMRVIEEEVQAALTGHGFTEVEVRTVLRPAWTTDWITEDGKRKLQQYGIAPPGPAPDLEAPLALGPTVRVVACPYCGSDQTTLRSSFGSTACKAMYYCDACHQPFEHFKAF
ncbi:MAG: 1,2-phenylacetyl-CoA epoxidase subunit PaaD [Gemmatimonadota bacterium]